MFTLPPQFKLKEFEGLPPQPVLEKISELRFLTWRATTDRIVRPDQHWIEARDSTAHHYVVYDGEVLASACRIHILSEWTQIGDLAWYDQLSVQPKPPIAALSRLVVHPNYQHQGIGKFLDAARVTRAKELGAASVVGDVPPYRVKHMERLGFTVVQPPKKGITLPNVEWTVVYLEF